MKKILALVACLSLVASLAIGGSIAYLTSTATKENTFTIGNVKIDIVEDGYTDKSTLTPGATVDKNAEIKNTGVNDAWVWMTVSIEPVALKDVVTLTYENDADWDTTTVPGVQLYKNVLTAGTGTTGIRLKSVSLAENVDVINSNVVKVVGGEQTTICTIDELDNLKVTINAYGIQTVGFTSVEYAYNGFVDQWGEGTPIILPTQVSNSADLNAALAAGKENGNVTIEYTGDELEISESLTINGNVKLQLSDSTKLTFTDGAEITVPVNSELSLYNAKIEEGAGELFAVEGTLTLGAGTTIENTAGKSNDHLIRVADNAKLILEGVEITNNEIAEDYDLIRVAQGAELVIKNGTKIANNKFTYSNKYGNYSMFHVNGTIRMEGGSIENNEFNNISMFRMEGASKFIMNGGNISNNVGTHSSSALFFKLGSSSTASVEINGGTITGNEVTSLASGLTPVISENANVQQ